MGELLDSAKLAVVHAKTTVNSQLSTRAAKARPGRAETGKQGRLTAQGSKRISLAAIDAQRLIEAGELPHAVLINGRRVAAFMPLRFASAHRFFLRKSLNRSRTVTATRSACNSGTCKTRAFIRRASAAFCVHGNALEAPVAPEASKKRCLGSGRRRASPA